MSHIQQKDEDNNNNYFMESDLLRLSIGGSYDSYDSYNKSSIEKRSE
jgi:hypothetical protein